MPTRLCIEPTCPNKAEVRGRCREHATTARRFTRSVNDAFYSSKPWKISRARQLFEHPLCEYVEDGKVCSVIADTVHHVVPIEDGGARRDPANLMSICRSHHSAHHASMGWDKR